MKKQDTELHRHSDLRCTIKTNLRAYMHAMHRKKSGLVNKQMLILYFSDSVISFFYDFVLKVSCVVFITREERYKVFKAAGAARQ